MINFAQHEEATAAPALATQRASFVGIPPSSSKHPKTISTCLQERFAQDIPDQDLVHPDTLVAILAHDPVLIRPEMLLLPPAVTAAVVAMAVAIERVLPEEGATGNIAQAKVLFYNF